MCFGVEGFELLVTNHIHCFGVNVLFLVINGHGEQHCYSSTILRSKSWKSCWHAHLSAPVNSTSLHQFKKAAEIQRQLCWTMTLTGPTTHPFDDGFRVFGLGSRVQDVGV